MTTRKMSLTAFRLGGMEVGDPTTDYLAERGRTDCLDSTPFQTGPGYGRWV